MDVAYAHCYRLLFCSHDDMHLRVYDMSCYSVERARGPTHPVLAREIKIPSNQITLCWDSSTRRLFSSGIDGAVLIWTVKAGLGVPSSAVEVVHTGALRQVHTDIVKDMMTLTTHSKRSLLVTAGMDSRICLWDTSKDTLKAKRTKHSQGVHSLAAIGDGYVLSAGFDCDIYCWNFDSTSREPYFVLDRTAGGHQNPILSVVACAESKQAFSIDINGSLRWWDVRLDSTILDSERCLQSFGMRDMSGKTCAFRPSALGIWPAQSPASSTSSASSSDSASSSAVLPKLTFPVVIATDAKLHVFSAIPKHPEVARVSCVEYNATTLSLFVAFGNDVQIWDADTGVLLRQLHDVALGITRMSLDNRERKFIVGSASGALTVHDCETGSLLKSGSGPRRGELVAIEYIDRDRCFITCSSDRMLCLHDDRFVERVPLLRSVSNIHSHDVVAMEFSPALSLIATGDSNGQIRVWDFQFFSIEKPLYPCIEGVEITALAFVEPYPLLLSADTNGDIWVWQTRRPGGAARSAQPAASSGDGHETEVSAKSETAAASKHGGTFQQPLAILDFWNSNFLKEAAVQKRKQRRHNAGGAGGAFDDDDAMLLKPSDSQITNMKVVYDPAGGVEIMRGIREGKYYLFVSLHNGWIFQLDLSEAISKLGVAPIPEEDFPVNAHNYFARRRFQRDDSKSKHPDQTIARAQVPPSKSIDLLLLKKWRAHAEVSRMELVEDPSSLVTISRRENTVGLWQATIPKAIVEAEASQNERDAQEADKAQASAPAATVAAAAAKLKGGDGKEVSSPGADETRSARGKSLGAQDEDKAISKATKVLGRRLRDMVMKESKSRTLGVVGAAIAAAARNDSVGKLLGKLNAKRLVLTSKTWSLPQRKPEQLQKDVGAARSLLGSEYFEKNQFATEETRASAAVSYDDLMDRVSVPHGKLRPEGRVEEPASPRQQHNGEVRGAILGQLYGKRTWKETALEASWYDTLEAERRNQQQKIQEAQRRREQVMQQASMEAREVAEYSELLDTDIAHHKMVRPTVRSSLPVPWLPATDSENWGINSVNRQKLMYSNLFNAKSGRRSPASGSGPGAVAGGSGRQGGRASPSLGRGVGRKGVRGRRPSSVGDEQSQSGAEQGRSTLSLHEKIEWTPSSFLEQQFAKRLANKKAGKAARRRRRPSQDGGREGTTSDMAVTVKSGSQPSDAPFPAPQRELTREEKIAAAKAEMAAKDAAFNAAKAGSGSAESNQQE
eukprot:INCI5535.1.p1 GENE.INCI5535.1~~INCI5535.1.p1  ORF type:complete len:1431 (-),score=285.07 INCI5535.1:1083-4799(-)